MGVGLMNMQPVEYQDGWIKATPRQVELQKPVVKAFLGRQYNNTINHGSVITGAEKKTQRMR
tara:strand:- start:346 stop:531 length:186 start_codon:yes stop_codon:yes gene_type:complete